jgi:RNA polymerase sigma-70 factor (ECF subfamily)
MTDSHSTKMFAQSWSASPRLEKLGGAQGVGDDAVDLSSTVHKPMQDSSMISGAETDLVKRIMEGDTGAEAEFVNRFSPGVLRIIQYQCRGMAPVDDLHQETFRIALEKIRRGDLREPERLAGFVCSLARNLVTAHYRRPSREDSLDDNQIRVSVPVHKPTQYTDLESKELARTVQAVLDDMKSPRDRELLFRYYVAEELKDEICADLRLSSLQFNRVLCRARDRFRELYKKLTNNSRERLGNL